MTNDRIPSPSIQQEEIWNALKQRLTSSSSTQCPHNEIEWPSFGAILDDIEKSDYKDVLKCPHDIVHKSKDGKAFCAYGTTCCCKMELFAAPDSASNGKSYTGLLAPGQTVEHCIIRLSTASKPPKDEKLGKFFVGAFGGKLKKAKLFPCVALKCFRKGNRSGNLLFAGAKIGQTSSNFFHSTLCTQVTERVPFVMKPIISKFYAYSKNPLSLGVSDFCTYDQNGVEYIKDANDESRSIQFPYVVMLQPVYNSRDETINDEEKPFDNFLNDLLQIPSGTTLFDIFACPTPSSALDASKIERIGRVVSTTEMILSNPKDGLFFRHQKKEEDFELRPEWREQTKAKCSPDGGKTVGTIDRLVGSTILGNLVRSNKYIDFEIE